MLQNTLYVLYPIPTENPAGNVNFFYMSTPIPKVENTNFVLRSYQVDETSPDSIQQSKLFVGLELSTQNDAPDYLQQCPWKTCIKDHLASW